VRPSKIVKGAALLAAASVATLAASPALAADPVAQASASAVTLSVAGQDGYSGTFSATNDGTKQTTSGNDKPLITALGGQSLLSAGTLAQDATTSVDASGRGSSAACAGLAGQGASLVAAGSGDCLSGGNALQLNAGTLDLSKLQIVQGTVLNGLDQQLQTALQPVLGTLLPALSQALIQGAQALGNPGIFLDLGAVQSHCTATPAGVSGDSSLANAAAYLQIPGGQRIDLLKLPVHPGPNTDVVTQLGSGVVGAITSALKTDLSTALGGQLGALGAVVDQTAVLNNILDQLGAQLKPLDDTLIKATLNKQTTSDGSITVTALDLSVLPAAQQFVHADLLHLTVGTSTCGPNGRVVTPAAVAVPKSDTHHSNPVPTTVPAGVADAYPLSDHVLTAGRVALLALVGLGATGAGLVGYRRRLHR
jgi:hypothetical protein